MKITLKNLHKATAQQVFDQVATHLLTQNKRSVDLDDAHKMCQYRGPNGLKCAAGCLIADEEYKEDFEGKDWYDLSDEALVPNAHVILILKLQSIHDSAEPKRWLEKLKELASEFNLNTKVL